MRMFSMATVILLMCLIVGCNTPLTWEETGAYEQWREADVVGRYADANGHMPLYGSTSSTLDPYREPWQPRRNPHRQ